MPTRCVLVVGTFLLSVLLYVDRACISAAKTDIAADLSLSDEQMGWVFAVFSLGYALCQTPAGMIADKLGPRKLLTSIVAIWSLFTGLTGAAWNYASLLVVRILFGAGEAGAFPGLARATYSWMPMQERGIVQGINFSGSRLGGALAFPLLAYMIDGIGWRASFLALMVVGVVWSIFWWWWFRDDPIESRGMAKEELDYILANRQQAAGEQEGDLASGAITASTLVGSPRVWLLCLQYFASNFTFFFALSWFLPYFKKSTEGQLDPKTAALYAAAPLIAGAFGNWASGAGVDWLYKNAGHVVSRRGPAGVGFLLASVGLVGTCYAATPLATISWFSLAIFGADMTLAPSWTFAIDVGGKQAGLVSGTMNMAGNVGGFVTSLAFPTLLAWSGSHEPFFFVAAGLNAVAIVCWLMLDPRRPLLAVVAGPSDTEGSTADEWVEDVAKRADDSEGHP